MTNLAFPHAPPESGMKAAGPPFDAFERVEREAASRREPAWVSPLRKAGLARFAELGFPTLQDEDWRFTNVAPIAALSLKPVMAADSGGVGAAALDRFAFAQLPGDRLVFVDGHFAPQWSRFAGRVSGLQIGSLKEALLADAALVEPHLGRHAQNAGQAFTALNDAYWTDGTFLRVPDGVVVAEPIQLLFVSTGVEAGRTAHSRNLFVLGARSQVTVLEQYVSLADAPVVTNVVTECVVGDSAVVEFVRYQDESPAAFHVGALHATIGRGANVRAHSFALGARLARQNITLTLAGEGLEAVLNGLYLTDQERLADHHMVVDHAQPNCASHEYFNGILSGRSKGVFHGRILVRPGAQKTDAKQTNKNLLLSADAMVDTKPQLEIYADDVKCTHGATIGQLNPESVFYLRSRGIPRETARRMLIHSFAGEIIERVQCRPIREELDRLVWDRLEQDEHVRVGG